MGAGSMRRAVGLVGLVLTLGFSVDVGSAPTAWSAEHIAAIRRAAIWVNAPTAATPLDPVANPDDRFRPSDTVTCRFDPQPVSGRTPKFDCTLPDGESVKVKYGAANPEVFGEVLASRLLAALGLPTDRMYVVKAVDCAGCPPDPFRALRCLSREKRDQNSCVENIDYSTTRRFEPAVVERAIPGRRIESDDRRGWEWNELDTIDPAAGGASHAEVDAFHLLAVFLAHWDNKAENQRLLCLGEEPDSTRCERPVAMIQDLGSTFGPNAVNLRGWRTYPVWADRNSCRVSMRALPYSGLTFRDVVISEEGRQFLVERLRRLPRWWIAALFRAARIADFDADPASRQLDQWVSVFEEKVADIVRHDPCPAIESR
jgi:hypothetical protein